ncbi:Nif3-like dinuclear metal center hexameric protein [Jonesiaceae bacterium BS-20]|uniref:GTP cyclohydrolase 1 type 2 homolog n=1 Tax=Jonesiaceae bacterium BS-20 TaxID=3120821 RepID=A0AAU7DT65_9MICO
MTFVASTGQTPNLDVVLGALDKLYPPRLAEGWDKIGLSIGRRQDPVRKILFAVDPVACVVDEAIAWGADLIVTHHPFFFTAVNSVSGDTDRGEIVHRLIQAECALFSAHTNADSAARGVNGALADLLGLVDTEPLVPAKDPADAAAGLGLGRVGKLVEPVTLGDFATVVADRLPKVAQGVRVAGDLGAMVQTVAVLGGSGESLAKAAAQAQADVYVTSDMKHHGALDLVAEFEHAAALAGNRRGGRPYLVDTAHYASESPWLKYGAEDLAKELENDGYVVEVKVCEINTDPWTIRL